MRFRQSDLDEAHPPGSSVSTSAPVQGVDPRCPPVREAGPRRGEARGVLITPRASNIRLCWLSYNPSITPSDLQQEPNYAVSGRAT
jgi:hypothetical protein